MSRRARTLLVLAGLALVLAGSAALARVLSASSAERSGVIALVRAQAHGDEAAVVDRIAGCRARAACRAEVRANVARLRAPGTVQVLRYEAPGGFTLGAARGWARIAWRIDGGLPVVQCVDVERAGSLPRGFTVRFLRLRAPIPGEAEC